VQAFSIATTGFTSSGNCQIGTAGIMALTLPWVMTPWEWIGIVMACSDTRYRTSADGRSGVIRCSGWRRSALRERAHELRAGFGRWGVQVRTENHEIVAQRMGAAAVGRAAGRPYATAIKAGGSDDDHGRDSMWSWEDSR
jgi:hypothetical protein